MIHVMRKNWHLIINFTHSATVTNLQQKFEQAMTTNALMKEDLAISKNTILELEEEKKQLETQRDTILHAHKHTIEVCSHCGHPIQNNNNVNDTWMFGLIWLWCYLTF